MTPGAGSVPFDVEDVPGYAGAIFDYLVAQPDLMRLRPWKLLERPSATALDPDAFRGEAAEAADAQQRGVKGTHGVRRVCVPQDEKTE
ncbi:hypothetical protein ACFXBB_17810 [Streptomyces scopuliridis]|uniref:hypothetical protein n=1 Tax=Streptomyces scopuliridis TaxID=452529 RepID=UPI003675B6F2